jgi:hypothetical protein
MSTIIKIYGLVLKHKNMSIEEKHFITKFSLIEFAKFLARIILMATKKLNTSRFARGNSI